MSSCCVFIHVRDACVFTCTHGHEDLGSAVCNLDVLVVQEAAHDGDVGLAVCGADAWSLMHLSPHTARPVFTPPGVMGGDVEGQKVTVLEGTGRPTEVTLLAPDFKHERKS